MSPKWIRWAQNGTNPDFFRSNFIKLWLSEIKRSPINSIVSDKGGEFLKIAFNILDRMKYIKYVGELVPKVLH